jgi:HAE1 family hydrophobic/amphiphilic exporter-1
VRPILITTITTIGGLIPLLFLETEESFLSGILEELSFVTITGLLGSTLLTVTVIPLVYYSIEKFRYRFSSLKSSAMLSYGKE